MCKKFTLEQAMKVHRKSKCSCTLSLTSALGGGRWSTPRPVALPPEKRPGIHCAGGWVGPRAGMEM